MIGVAEAHDVPAAAGQDALVAGTRPPPAEIRWTWVPKGNLEVPIGVRPEGRFRPDARAHASSLSSCLLPTTLPQMLLEIDSALRAAMSFIRKLLEEERQMFGPERMRCHGKAYSMRISLL